MRQSPKTFFEFLSLLAIGISIFLATDNFVAGAVLPATRAAWRSLRTAVWILRSDHSRLRARICSAFCLATAAWQAATGAFVSVIVFVIVMNMTGRQPNMDRFAATMIQLSGGVALTTAVGLMASIAAVNLKVRVWVHPKLREMVDGDLSAAMDLPVGRFFNYAIFVVATSVAFPCAVVPCTLLINPKWGLFGLVFPGAGAIAGFMAYVWLSSRIIASSPAECWK